MSDKKVFSTVTKNLLKNVIRHTDSHNKVVEETDMWRQREKQVTGRGRDSRGSDYSFLKDSRSDMRFEFESRRERSAHMDEEPQSTYWMKQLYKAEEADKNRWGHSGFKELYPKHFTSTDYSSSSDDDSRRKHKKSRHKSNHSHRKSKKRKHADSDSLEAEKPKKHKKKHKHKDKKKHKKSKHKKKRRKKESSSESS